MNIRFFKNSGHLEFSLKHAAILDLVCFCTFILKIIFLLHVHHCTVFITNSDASYSSEENIYIEHNLASLPII